MMTTHLIISDVHEDIQSLNLLLDNYKGQFQDIWLLGDVAGHSEHLNGAADVVICYQILYEYHKQNRLTCVAGNWEKWAWSTSPSAFSVRWENELNEVRKKISDNELRDWITGWPITDSRDDFTLTHGWIDKLPDQKNSELWETYLGEKYTDSVNLAFLFNRIHTPHALLGHTHNPGYFLHNEIEGQSKWIDLDSSLLGQEQKYQRSGIRYIFNPGSLSGARSSRHNGLKTAILLDTDRKTFRFISL